MLIISQITYNMFQSVCAAHLQTNSGLVLAYLGFACILLSLGVYSILLSLPLSVLAFMLRFLTCIFLSLSGRPSQFEKCSLLG